MSEVPVAKDSAAASLRSAVRASLEANADAAYREKITELVPSGSEIIGVRVPRIRELAREFAAAHKALTLDAASDLMDELCAGRCREEILFGTFILARFRRAFGAGLWKGIDRWVDAVENWETCDQLAMNVAGELVAKDPALVDELVRWAVSENPWRRRFAVACTTVLNQKGRSLARETLRVCDVLMTDTEPNVQKAVAWAVREATKSDEQAVYDFLKRWKETAARRIFREACEKLNPHQRAELLAA